MPLLRILLVDDDDIVREALRILLAREQRLNIVGSVASGEEALIAAVRLRPDLVILDLGLPGLSGIDTMRSLIRSLPRVRVIVLSARESPEEVQQAVDAGAAGYVFKSSAAMDLPDAVRAIIGGARYTPSSNRGNPADRRPPGGTAGVHDRSRSPPCPAANAS